MTQDDQPPGGLLSKVVKFVRNPTMNWADLDQSELDHESQYSKHMLKEMIERKRRNDFVRRREFDQLRKLRQRGAVIGPVDLDAAGRPSFFQSSQPSRADDREGTLKKIAEIEAQMSQQWWNKGQTPPAAGAARTTGGRAGAAAGEDPQFAATVPATLPGAAGGYAATHPAAATQEAQHADGLMPDWGYAHDDAGTGYVHDPALEDAALRFANGDTAGAEAALLPQLGTSAAASPAHEEIWLTLFDLYRASGQHDKFDTAAIEFAMRFGRSAPAWFSMETGARTSMRARLDGGAHLNWICPVGLGLAHVEALQAKLLAQTPAVLGLDWGPLGSIQQAAAGPLADVLAGLARQPLLIQCVGGDHLESLLRSLTLSGDRKIDPVWWQLRLEWLRLMQQPDAFDLAALDYCVTYEVSPPAWQEARCNFESLQGTGASLTGPQAGAGFGADSPLTIPDSAAPSTLPQGDDGQIGAAGALSGVLLGDATQALVPLEPQARRSGLAVVSCERLVRVDFAAAGSVLNWAATLQAAGVRVQFRELHRLAAVFLNVVGVAEHAKILPRRY